MIPLHDRDWSGCRNYDHTLNLYDVFARATGESVTEEQAKFLQDIMDVRPVVSRQMAALAVAVAARIK